MLRAGAPDAVLVRAAAANQRTWFALQAEAAGGIVRREPGLTWTLGGGVGAIAFPALARARADTALAEVVAAARAAQAREVSCWSLLPTRPRDLGERLLRLGFELGWQAHWMALDLDHAGSPAEAAGVDVAVVEPEEPWAAEGLPYDDPGAAERRRVLAAATPRRVWHLAARRDGIPVGHATLCVSTGRIGVAGLYDVGVRADQRRRGIGRALTALACSLARAQGYRHATLNATSDGEQLYAALGFHSVGVAQTWWLHLPQGPR
jgi:ribosomal protein S18 acetylase RimI-like enzyme